MGGAGKFAPIACSQGEIAETKTIHIKTQSIITVMYPTAGRRAVSEFEERTTKRAD